MKYGPGDRWWLRLRFLEGGWEIVGQTQDETVVSEWDDDIDDREQRTGIDHEWLIPILYGAQRVEL